MFNFEKYLNKQIEAAERITVKFGTNNAICYLIGEKCFSLLEITKHSPEYSKYVPEFFSKVKKMFNSWEIKEYLDYLEKTKGSNEGFEDENNSEYIDPVKGAEYFLIVERMRKLLLTPKSFHNDFKTFP